MTDNPGWQPRHDDPLFILAMDHRASFGKTLFGVKDDDPSPDQIAAMKSAKWMIFEGLRAALPAVTRGRAGVLVDERYGQDVIDAVKRNGGEQPVAVAVPIEASGHDWFTLGMGRSMARARRGDQAGLRQGVLVGFAIGRSIWVDAVRAYEASDRDEAPVSAGALRSPSATWASSRPGPRPPGGPTRRAPGR